MKILQQLTFNYFHKIFSPDVQKGSDYAYETSHNKILTLFYLLNLQKINTVVQPNQCMTSILYKRTCIVQSNLFEATIKQFISFEQVFSFSQ